MTPKLLWVLLLLGTALVVEGFLRLPVAAKANELLSVVRKIANTMRSSRISDHWKERVLPRYAGKLFTNSIWLFVLVVLALCPMVLLGLAADTFFGVGFMAFLMTATAIVCSTVFAIFYVFVRQRFL